MNGIFSPLSSRKKAVAERYAAMSRVAVRTNQSPRKPRNIAVYDENMKPVAPCSEKTAWTLVTRQRAHYLDECKTSIQITVSNRAIKELKRRIIEEAGRICYICNRYIPLSEKATVDHLYPKYIDNNDISGLDTEENMACCCEACNHHKGNMDIDTYMVCRIASLVASFCVNRGLPVTRQLLTKLLCEGDGYGDKITTDPAAAYSCISGGPDFTTDAVACHS
jgi:5-methylcytosine-specific restriction endonuclease McrA